MDDSSKIKVNYIYFGLFLIFLILISTNSILIRENLSGSRPFFWLYAVGQAVLEVSLFAFAAAVVERFLGRFWLLIFIGATFICLLFHIFDFATDRILDLSIYETFFIFVLQETADQFYYLLDASGVPFWVWAILFGAIAAVPLIGIGIYKTTEYAVEKKPLYFKLGSFLILFLSLPAALFLWDLSASKMIHPNTYTAFIQALPWKFTFLPPQTIRIPLNGPSFIPEHEIAIAAEIAKNRVALAKKPNIYIFIVESLREDFVTTAIAPHLDAFKKENIHYKMALSNGNGTNISWFSIFHSQFPYFWNRYQKLGWEMGSPALNLLKQWGYQIRVYTSAQLGYYGMDELLFGKDHQLLDSYQAFHHIPPISAADTDAAAIDHLQKDLSQNPSLAEGQVFIVFWDSTHFDYKWPKNQMPKFTPIATEFAYVRAFNSKRDMEPIKNRYRNSVHYIDELFGNFLNNIPRKEEAIVVVAGDHGEEFYEHGHLFHGSHLIHEQTNVPIYFKFGKGERTAEKKEIVSQMDIFPSIIDYLSDTSLSFLEGESIFQKSKWPFAIISRFHAGNTPYEFCIHNGRHKIIAQFVNRRNIFDSRELRIRSVCCCKDQTFFGCDKNMRGWIQAEFGPVFQRLFIEHPVHREAASASEQSAPFPLCALPLCP
ncbi:MAG TPA: sulfatase-like hydrolase/transferase [Chlamydiales bacterium]|nr:sulfatase-like hydrolase/transferase [Chlamydiales bacterium]